MSARRKKVSFKNFVTGYKAGCEEGLTALELADKLEMHEPSMTSRASNIRQQAAEIGKHFPSPAGGGVTIAEKKKAKVALLTSLLGDLDDDETETEAVDSDESVE